MITFKRKNPESAGAMFLPAGALFHAVDHVFAEGTFEEGGELFVIGFLMDMQTAFPGLVTYTDWRQVVEVPGYVEQEIDETTWYLGKEFQTEIFLTTEEQFNYAALKHGVTLE